MSNTALAVEGILIYNGDAKKREGTRRFFITKEETMEDRERPRRVRRESVTGALILIVLGCILLLNNLGYLPGDIWITLWRFWPVILILGGVDIALRGFPGWFAFPVLILVVVVIIGGILLVAPTLPPISAGEIVTESLSQELGALSQAEVHLEMDRGILYMQALEDQSRQLMEGQFSHSSYFVIQKEFSESAGRGSLRLADRYEIFFPFFFLTGMRNDWNVELTPLIPLELELEVDDSQLDLNLDGLNIQILSAELDDSNGEVALPSTDDLNANLNLDETDLTVSVPADAAARIELSLSDTQLTIDSSRFMEISETEYVSRGYDEADIKLDVTLRARDSSVSIK
jgi:hypothetical protein